MVKHIFPNLGIQTLQWYATLCIQEWVCPLYALYLVHFHFSSILSRLQYYYITTHFVFHFYTPHSAWMQQDTGLSTLYLYCTVHQYQSSRSFSFCSTDTFLFSLAYHSFYESYNIRINTQHEHARSSSVVTDPHP